MARFDQVTIVGLGLIGGSLGMALRRRRLAKTVVGLSRRAATLRRARERGAVDWGTTDPRRAVRNADLVVLAVPVSLIVPIGKTVARFMRPGSILTDVGSTKAAIVQKLDSLSTHVSFVGGHPIAGSEQQGIDAADGQLFQREVCVLTPTRRTAPGAVRAVTQLWRGLGAQVVIMSPSEHDRQLAATSHLPHLIAYALAKTGVTRVGTPRSFLEMTRIAKSDPDLWDDIFLNNQGALAVAVGRFHRELHALEHLVARGKGRRLRQALRRAKVRRDALESH